MQRLLDGDLDAPAPRSSTDELDALVRAHGPMLRAIARRLCNDAHDAADLVQDTLERALVRFATFAPGTCGRSWLVAILHNAFIDQRRRAQRRGIAVVIDEDTLPASASRADEPVWAAFDLRDVIAAIDSLDDGFRDVYRMHAIERRSYEEIAAALGIPKTTVGTRLLRARQKLRALLLALRRA